MKLPWIEYLNLFSDLLPLVAAIFKWRRIKAGNNAEIVVLSFIVLGILSEYVSFWMISYGIHNLWVLHLYHLGEYILLMIVFISWLKNENISLWFIQTLQWLVPFYIVIWFISKWSFEKWDEPASYTHVWSTMIFIVLSLSVYYRLLKRSDAETYGMERSSIFKSFKFWITSGIFFYFSGSAVLFLFMPLVIKLSRESAIAIYIIHWTVNLTSNLFYTCGFLCLTESLEER